MIRQIPLTQVESNYSQTVTLDGEDYTFRFLWNDRDRHWYLTVRDVAGDDILAGIKVVADIPITTHCSDDRIYPGELWVIDTTGAGQDPGLRDFGSRVLLYYVDEEDVA